MKIYLFIMLLFVSTFLKAQEQLSIVMQGVIKIKSMQGENTSINMLLKNNELAGGVIVFHKNSAKIKRDFTFGIDKVFTEYYLVAVSQGEKNISNMEYKYLLKKEIENNLDKNFIRFYFSPLNYKNRSDSIKMFCKYVYFKQKEGLKDNTAKYDVIYNECFFNAPIEKEYELKVFNKYLLTSQKIFVNFSKQTGVDFNIPLKYAVVDSSSPNRIPLSFAKMQSEAKFIKSNLKIGMELLRTDTKGEKIVDRQLFFPLHNTTIQSLADTTQRRSNYRGAIKAPLVIYTPDKKLQFEKFYKNRIDNYRTYTIELVTLQITGAKYKFGALITINDGMGKTNFIKEFEVEVGGRVKLELLKDKWSTDILADDKVMKIDSQEDFHKYVNEYLIINLESEE